MQVHVKAPAANNYNTDMTSHVMADLTLATLPGEIQACSEWHALALAPQTFRLRRKGHVVAVAKSVCTDR